MNIWLELRLRYWTLRAKLQELREQIKHKKAPVYYVDPTGQFLLGIYDDQKKAFVPVKTVLQTINIDGEEVAT